MSNGSVPTFACGCKQPKEQRRLRLDGGSAGLYDLELCMECYRKEDRQFVVSDVPMSSTAGGFRPKTKQVHETDGGEKKG